jgi:hypothetical protein
MLFSAVLVVVTVFIAHAVGAPVNLDQTHQQLGMASPNGSGWTSSPTQAPKAPTLTDIVAWVLDVTLIVTATPSIRHTSRWEVQPTPTTSFAAPAVPSLISTGQVDGNIDETGKWGLGSWIAVFSGLLGAGIFGVIVLICYRWTQAKKIAPRAPINLWDLVRGKQARPQNLIKVQELARAQRWDEETGANSGAARHYPLDPPDFPEAVADPSGRRWI